MSRNQDPPSTPLYAEASLDRPSFSIRLLQITLQDTGNIDWMLVVHDLKSSPLFVALSYEWGDGLANKKIRLNGHDILIRENLYQALYSLVTEVKNPRFNVETSSSVLEQRRPPFSNLLEDAGGAIFLWVDALCIDQGCRSEREMQVANMGQIYSSAATVLVWLGLHSEDSHELIRCLKLRKPNAPGSNSLNLQPALNKILNRSYWSRMWIVQEIYLAKDLIAGCGDSFFQWDSFQSLLDLPSQLRFGGETDITQTKAWQIIQQRMARGAEGSGILKRRLDKNIIDFGGRECSDIRDRVYSLLSISWTSKPLLVDYSIDSEELFVRVVGSVDWENAAWRDIAETIHFENLLQQLCRSLNLDQIPEKARRSVESIKTRMKNEDNIPVARVSTGFRVLGYASTAKCTIS